MNAGSDPVIDDLMTLDWYEIETADKGESYHTADLTRVEIVDVTDGFSQYDSYGYVIVEEFFVILKTLDGRLFRRTGLMRSYGHVDWKNDLKEVKQIPRTVTVYDYI